MAKSKGMPANQMRLVQRLSYGEGAISRRTGLSRSEIQQLRSEERNEIDEEQEDEPQEKIQDKTREKFQPRDKQPAQRNATRNGGRRQRIGSRSGISVDFGTGEISAEAKGFGVLFNPVSGETGISAFGFGITYNPGSSEGEIFAPKVSMQVSRSECILIKTFTINGKYIYSNMEIAPDCERVPEPPNEQPITPPGNPGSSVLPQGDPNDIVFRVIPGSGGIRNPLPNLNENWNEMYNSSLLTVVGLNFRGEPIELARKNNLSYIYGIQNHISINPVRWDYFAQSPSGSVIPTFKNLKKDEQYNPYFFLIPSHTTFCRAWQTGWSSESYVAFQGPRHYVDEQTTKYYAGYWSVVTCPIPIPMKINSLGSYAERINICCEYVIKRSSIPSFPRPESSTTPGGKNMDCCKRILRVLSETQYPIKVPKRWIDRKIKNPFDENNFEELETITDVMMTLGKMLDRFEEIFNPAGEDSAFPLKAKDANWMQRMMGQSGDDYQYPDPGDERKPEDNRQIKSKSLPINNYMDIFKYLLESQIRLENILPYAEMSDSEIDKGLLWPKHEGNYKITNLIQFQECLFLYLNNIIGDPTVPIVLKDANPAIAGDQPLTTEFLNLSDIMRKAYRQGLDTANDVDLSNNFNKRSLYELLVIHQTIVCIHELCESIAEDLDFKEIQEIISVPMAADPYAGRRDENGNFIEDPTLDENTEEAVETNLDKFLIQTSVDVKVSHKDPAETTSLRDLIAQIGRYAAEASAASKMPASPEAIQAAIDAARAAIQAQGALTRLDVQQALTGGRYRKKKPRS